MEECSEEQAPQGQEALEANDKRVREQSIEGDPLYQEDLKAFLQKAFLNVSGLALPLV